MSAPKRARLPESLAAAGAALSVCAAEDVTLPCFASLPVPVALRIFALLPADARARAAAVCQTWHYQLTAGPSAWRLWTELDLSGSSGVMCARGDAALEGAAALARGRLRTLKLRAFDTPFQPHTFTETALHRVLIANAGLEELSDAPVGNAWTTVEQVQALLAAAPALQRLTVGVQTTDVTVARAMLRREPPYAALRVGHVLVNDETGASPLRTADGVIALAADVAACDALTSLQLIHGTLQAPAAMEALVDAALTRRLGGLLLWHCTFAPAVALPQLARLIADGRTALAHLSIAQSPTLFANAQEADIEALCDALAQSTNIGTVHLCDVGLPEPEKMFVALRRALASRPAGCCPVAVVTVA